LSIAPLVSLLPLRALRDILAPEQDRCWLDGTMMVADLIDKNEGALVLDIGRLGPRGLTESRLSTMAAAATWKKILAHLKKHTKAGVIGVHEQSGASGRYSSQRYTAGAKALFEAGIALRQFTQSAVIFQPES
jgi:hypothetical protein